MWRPWRPFLVLVLIDTILNELGSGAASVGSNSNEIPVVAQEPLSATGSFSGAQSDHPAQLLSSFGSNPGEIQTSASLLKTSTSTSDRITHIRADAASPGSDASNGAQSDLSRYLESLGSILESLAIRLVGSLNPPKTTSSDRIAQTSNGHARIKKEAENIPLGSKARNGDNSNFIDLVLGGLHIGSLGNLDSGIQKLARLLNPPKTSTSTSDGTARVLNDNEPQDITDKPMNCRFKTTKIDVHELGVCPSGCYTWPLKGQCWCPRTTKENCETEKHCHWSVVAQVEGKCVHNGGRLHALGSLLNPLSETTPASDRSAQVLNVEPNSGSNAINAAQTDLLVQLLTSSGEPPLDVSEFLGIPAAAAVSESATGSNSESRPEGIQALASLLNRANMTTSTINRIAQDFNGEAGVEEDVESCRFKTTNALGGSGLGGCAANCASLFPAVSGQCLCPRNTKADCETKKGCSWSVVSQACIHQFEGLYNALFKKLDKRGDTSELTEEPYKFAYSIALSPVAAAGISTTGEIGVAFGSTGEIMGFAARCLGLKADVSVELDIALGFWNSIDDILGPHYQVGVGADTTEFKNENGTDETGAHVEQIYNTDGRYIGFAISLGYGYGVDLPIDWEVNFDRCRNYELWRYHWKDLYNMIWESRAKPIKDMTIKDMTIKDMTIKDMTIKDMTIKNTLITDLIID